MPRSRQELLPRTSSNAAASRGFTLVEVALVVAIVGIVTLGVTLTLLPKLQRATAEEALERLIECDRRCRTIARNTGYEIRLWVDPDAGTLTLQEAEKPDRVVLTLQGRLELTSVLTRDGTKSGRFDVRYGAEGRSESYAIGVIEDRRRSRWVMVAGMTGDVLRDVDDREIEAIFSQLREEKRSVLAPARSDAH